MRGRCADCAFFCLKSCHQIATMFRVMSAGQIKGGVKNIFKLSGRRSPWVVDITVLGKRQRRFFATKREALDYLDNWKLARKMDLQYFISLSGEQIKDIKDAMDALPRGKTLLQSVRKAWRFFPSTTCTNWRTNTAR